MTGLTDKQTSIIAICRMQRGILKIFITLSLVAGSYLSHAQDSNFGAWWIYFGNKQINPAWNWHHEIQYRNYNFVGDLEQLLIRTGFGYNLSENNNNLLFGYGFIRSDNYNSDNTKSTTIEHRLYLQFITKQKFSRVTFQHRYRFEQRFIENLSAKYRFRYFLSLNVALNNKEIIDNTFYFSAYNEIFINTEEPVFDRNRLYGGFGYKLNKTFKFELAYMNQFLNQDSRDQLNAVMFANF